jgi:4-diphosphocytidyl-2-C-methyl-D-erythritol kinase
MKLAAAAGVDLRGRIELEKLVPPGGGMGGGSSDAAGVLVALNEVWGLHWEPEQLEKLAAELGSDVPFFVRAQPSLCTGRGEIMTPLPGKHQMFAVLILPGKGCATKEVFAAFDHGHGTAERKKTDWAACAAAQAEQLNEILANDLEPAAFVIAPWLKALRNKTQEAAGQRVMMTGSGSTLFTLFSTREKAETVRNNVQGHLEPPGSCVLTEVLLRG